MLKNCLFVCFLSFFTIKGAAQTTYEPGYFRSPLDIELSLAGNFGELRNNHFHSGLDIKTQNKEGLKIYAVADGYVSRIKISPFGYGKSIYITHPNGYISLYAHLQGFNDTIGTYIRAEQFKQENFAIEIFPPKGRLVIKQGDIIALSGNTGGSTGPHLHFEIREERTEKIVNPLYWGFALKDNQKPVIKEVAIFPIDINSRVNKLNKPFFLKVTKVNGIYKPLVDTIKACGKIGLGIEGYDMEDLSSNKNGIYAIEMKVNNKKIYSSVFEKFAFDETRYINCYVDYPYHKNTQRSFLLKNNRLGIYKDIIDRGILTIATDSVYKIEYEAKDFFGNISVIRFYLKGIAGNIVAKDSSVVKPLAIFHFADTNKFTTQDLSILLPPNILYEDIQFTYKCSKAPLSGTISNLHSIHSKLTPVHSYYSISIRCPELPEKLKDKAFIASIDNAKKTYNEGGILENGYINTQTRSFGNFAIALDTTPPVIKPLNISNNKIITGQQNISFKVTDDLTGIVSYRGTIDGKWVLFEYDGKKDKLTYEKENLSKGKHKLSLEVKDDRKNSGVLNIEFIE